MTFKDHFSKHATAYATFRPSSPKALFSYLAELSPDRHLAWDVGTGNGQAALGLVSYFEEVIATDASAQQIENAIYHPKITYKVLAAEKAPKTERRVDLVTVAQAVHWFKFDAFYTAVREVISPKGVIALWTYDLATISPEIDAIVRHYDVILKEYWPAERRYVDEHYQSLPFPFEEMQAPPFEMIEQRNLHEWCGYLYTWSATQRAMKELGEKPYTELEKQLRIAWGNPEEKKTVKWPLYMRVGRAP